MKTIPRYHYRVRYYNSAQDGSRTESRHRSIKAACEAAEKLNRRIRNDGYSHHYSAEYYDHEDGWMTA